MCDTLASLGLRPRRSAVTGPDSLTPTERRVAELAAASLTNRQVAEALFVTVKTVETHLARVYQKLGIATRAELVRSIGPRSLRRLADHLVIFLSGKYPYLCGK